MKKKRKPISAAEKHRAEVEAGVPLNVQGLGELVSRGDRLKASGDWIQATTWYRRALKFSELLLGVEDVWTASICGKLADAIERSGAASSHPESQEVENLWHRAQAFFHQKNNQQRRQRIIRHRSKQRPSLKQTTSSGSLILNLEDLRDGQAERKGAAANQIVVTLENLTPRGAEACTRLKIKPSRLQKRDFHSFRKPGLSCQAQLYSQEKYNQQREKLLKEALEERWVIQQDMASQQRESALQERREQEQLERSMRRKKGDKNPRRSRSDPKPILGNDGKKNPYKGAFRAATDIAFEREICCPSCGTVHDFCSVRCRTCTRQVNWEEVIAASNERFQPPLSQVTLVAAYPRASCFPVVYSALAEDPAGPLPANEKAAFIASNSNGLRSRLNGMRRERQGRRASWTKPIHQARSAQLDKLENLLGVLQDEQVEEIQLEMALCGPKAASTKQVSSLVRAGARERVLDYLEKNAMVSCRALVDSTLQLHDSFCKHER